MSEGFGSEHLMWFEASYTLRHNAEQFIQNIHEGDRTPQNGLLQRVLEELVSQCLETYFLAPLEKVGLDPLGRNSWTPSWCGIMPADRA